MSSEVMEITNFPAEYPIVEKLRANIPEELKKRKQFVVRHGKRPYAWLTDKKGKTAYWKVDENGLNRERQRTELFDFEQAIDSYRFGSQMVDDRMKLCKPSGLGIIMMKTSTNPFIIGGDLDKCRDPVTGFITPWAHDILLALHPFYSEVSPSGTGIRFFCYGMMDSDSLTATGPQDQMQSETWEHVLQVKPDASSQNELELYSNGHHLSLTGDRLQEFCYGETSFPATFDIEFLEPWITSKKEKNTNQVGKAESGDWVEYKQSPFRRLTLEAVGGMPEAGDLGIIDQGSEILGCHPIHGSEQTHKNYSVDLVNDRFHCYRHGTGGDVVSFLAMKWGFLDCGGCVSGAIDRDMYLKIWQRAYDEGLDVNQPPISIDRLLARLEADAGLIRDEGFQVDLGRLSKLDQEYFVAEGRKRKIIPKELKTKTILDAIRGQAESHQLGEERGQKPVDEVPEEIDPELRNKAMDVLETDIIGAVVAEVQKNIKTNGDVPTLTLFAGISAYLSDPVHIDVCGDPELGKSTEVVHTLSLFPQDKIKVLSEASPKSLYYFAKDVDLSGWIVYIDDVREDHIPILKSFRNDGPVTPSNLTVVDGESLDLVVNGRPTVIASSVLALRDLLGQASSRSIQATITAPKKSTEDDVHTMIRKRIRLGPLFTQPNEESSEAIRAAIQILRDEGIKTVVIPYDAVEPEGLKRRGTGQFQRLIGISAFLNQMKRPTIELEDETRLVLAEYEDLRIAADLWFRFDLGQRYKIGPKHLVLLKNLPDWEPREEGADAAGTAPSLAKISGMRNQVGSQKTVSRYLEDLYDAGLVFRKQIKLPGNPYSYWVDKELKQSIVSEIPQCGEVQLELGQTGTNNGCTKYMAQKSPDSLQTSIGEFFNELGQDIVSIRVGNSVICSPACTVGVRGMYTNAFSLGLSKTLVQKGINALPLSKIQETALCPSCPKEPPNIDFGFCLNSVPDEIGNVWNGRIDLKSSPILKKCKSEHRPYLGVFLEPDGQNATVVLDCTAMQGSKGSKSPSQLEFYTDTLPISEVGPLVDMIRSTIDQNPGMSPSQLVHKVIAHSELKDREAEAKRLRLMRNTPGIPLPGDDEETAWLKTHFTPAMEDRLSDNLDRALPIPFADELRGVLVEDLVDEEVGIDEELVTRYLEWIGFARYAEDPEFFLAPQEVADKYSEWYHPQNYISPRREEPNALAA